MAQSQSVEPQQQRLSSSEFWARAVLVRENNEASAMNGLQRMKRRVATTFRRVYWSHGSEFQSKKKNEDVLENADKNIVGLDNHEQLLEDRANVARKTKQYRLDAIRQVKTSVKNRICAFLTCFAGTSNEFGVNASQSSRLARSLHWCFRVNVFVLFTLMCVVYFAIALIFGGLIVAAGVSNPRCVFVGTHEFGSFGSRFYDAFSLSWSTLGTIGYGSVYPALSNQSHDRTNCMFITSVTSFEAFVGIVYTGFCGAMLFAKVLRIQSHAQVMFSDPLLIRYGSGAESDDLLQPESYSDDEGKNLARSKGDIGSRGLKKRKIPLPFLEFRVVNRNGDQPGGEIIDARLNVVASVDAQDSDPSTPEPFDPEQRWKRSASSVIQSMRRGNSMKFVRSNHQGDETASDSSDNRFSSVASQDQQFEAQERSSLEEAGSSRFVDPYGSFHGGSFGWGDDERHRRRGHLIPKIFQSEQTSFGRGPFRGSHPRHSNHSFSSQHRSIVDEDPESRFVTKRIFSKMELEANDHPFFKHVWFARHILNETSPIVKPRVRRRIWPEDLNTHQGVRDSLSFNQIIVSFQGVSNVSAATVFAQKIYHYVDLSVGYQFVGVIFCNTEGELQIQTDLINDVVEQAGGGGEPLI